MYRKASWKAIRRQQRNDKLRHLDGLGPKLGDKLGNGTGLDHQSSDLDDQDAADQSHLEQVFDRLGVSRPGLGAGWSGPVPVSPSPAGGSPLGGGPDNKFSSSFLPTLLCSRVDALQISARVQFFQGVQNEIDRFRSDGAIVKRMAVQFAGLPWAGQWSIGKTISGVSFEGHNWRLDLIPSQSSPADADGVDSCGVSVKLAARAIFLAVTPLKSVIAEAKRIVHALGQVQDLQVTRIDLAADYEHFPLYCDDARNFVRHGRTKVTQWEPTIRCDADCQPVSLLPPKKPRGKKQVTETELALDGAVFYLGPDRVCSGWVVAPGNELMLRIYNKNLELEVKLDDEKKRIESARWTEHGWTGGVVSRVELQLRGSALTEFGLRDLDALTGFVTPELKPGETEADRRPDFARLDSVWQSAVVRWFSLRVPAGLDAKGKLIRRSRWALDPRWEVVRNTVFVHATHETIKRTRKAKGMTIRQALGGLVSICGQEGVSVTQAAIGAESVAARDVGLECMVDRMLAEAKRVIMADLIDKEADPSLFLAHRLNAALARFGGTTNGKNDGSGPGGRTAGNEKAADEKAAENQNDSEESQDSDFVKVRQREKSSQASFWDLFFDEKESVG